MASSLAGVLALPAAVLHNQPFFVPSQSPKSGIHDAVVVIIIIVEAVITTLFASIGAKLSRSTNPMGARRFLLAWSASLFGGCMLGLGGSFLLLFLNKPVYCFLWNALLIFLMAFSFASLGVFYLYGLPMIAITRLSSFAPIRRKTLFFWLWLMGAAAVGGLVLAVVFFNVVDRTGVGVEGDGLFVFISWPYASWGAGIGAAYAYNRSAQLGWRTGK